MVTTNDTSSPSAEWMGVAFMRAVTDLPSGTCMTISSARTVSAGVSASATVNSCSENSRPSARRTVMTRSRSAACCPGSCSVLTIRCASRLTDTRSPLRASNTDTPIGAVSTSASRSLRACCSSR